jgi:hypothetical protein
MPLLPSDGAGEVLGEDAVIGIDGLGDLEAGPLDHRLEQPGEGRVLVADVLLELAAAPLGLETADGARRAPRLDSLLGVGRLESVDDVRQAEQATRPQDTARPGQATAFQKSGRWWSA